MVLHSTAGEFAKLKQLIGAIEIALLTTVDGEGHFHTRPVQTMAVEVDGTLWFFTDARSEKAFELMRDVRLSLGYADPKRRRYVAISGSGQLLRDPNKARELWSMEQRAYYPDGPEDERLAILRVQIERAEYWLPSGRAAHMLAGFKARVTGIPAAVVGRNSKIR
jgi:general stress protein 26